MDASPPRLRPGTASSTTATVRSIVRGVIRARVQELRRRMDLASPTPGPAAAEPDGPERMRALEERVAHLEAALEGLQDSTYRQSVASERRIEDLQRRTAPREMARALNEDARDRGL